MPIDQSIATARDRFYAAQQHAHKSNETQEATQSALNAFIAWLDNRPESRAIETIDTLVLEQYVTYLRAKRLPPKPLSKKERHLKETTIRAYIGVIVRWLDWLTNRGELLGIPDYEGRLVKPSYVRELLEAFLSKRQPPVAPRMPDLRRLPGYYELLLQKFLKEQGVPIPNNPKQAAERRLYYNLLRNRALIATIFSTGGRISEVLSLTVGHVVGEDGSIEPIVEIRGKGRKTRPLRLDTLACDWISAYLDARGAEYGGRSMLFLSHGPKANGKGMSAVSAWRVVHEAAQWLADERKREHAPAQEVAAIRAVSPHGLRHFLAQAMLDEGADYKDIAAVLGHSSSVITEQFYAVMSAERTVEVADQYAPRAIISSSTKHKQ